MHKMMKILEFFMNKNWNWSCQNTDMLNKMLSENDRQVNFMNKYFLKQKVSKLLRI